MSESINPNEQQPDHPDQNTSNQNTGEHTLSTNSSIAEEIGAVGGGILGAALGKSVKGNVGAIVGGIAGAIAGGIAANSAAQTTQELIQETQPTVSLGRGADQKSIDLPPHYTWEELQALSRP